MLLKNYCQKEFSKRIYWFFKVHGRFILKAYNTLIYDIRRTTWNFSTIENQYSGIIYFVFLLVQSILCQARFFWAGILKRFLPRSLNNILPINILLLYILYCCRYLCFPQPRVLAHRNIICWKKWFVETRNPRRLGAYMDRSHWCRQSFFRCFITLIPQQVFFLLHHSVSPKQ